MFSEGVGRYKDFVSNYFVHLLILVHDLWNNKTTFLALFNTDFKIA